MLIGRTSFHAHKSNNAVCCSVCSLAILSVLRRSRSAKYTKKGYGYRKIQKAYAWCTELSAWCCKTPLDTLNTLKKAYLDCLKRITGPNTIDMLQRTAPLVSNHRHCIDSLLLFPLLATANHYAGSTVFLFQAPPFDSSPPSPHVHETLSLRVHHSGSLNQDLPKLSAPSSSL